MEAKKKCMALQWPAPVDATIREGAEVQVNLHLHDRPLDEQIAAVERLRTAGVRWGKPDHSSGNNYWLHADQAAGLRITAYLSSAAALGLDGEDARARRLADLRSELAELEGEVKR